MVVYCAVDVGPAHVEHFRAKFMFESDSARDVTNLICSKL